MGRCPVRSIFPQALDMLKKKQDLLGYVTTFPKTLSTQLPRSLARLSRRGTFVLTICESRFMADKIMPLSEALEGYEIFDNMKAQKVVFKVD